MAVIVDTSVVIAILLNEKSKAKIIEATVGEDLIAPFSLHWEVGNAFSAMMKKNKLTFKDAKNALEDYFEIPIRFIDVDLESALQISSKHNLYAYDSYFIISSKNNKLPLITLDKKLIEAAAKEGIRIIEV